MHGHHATRVPTAGRGVDAHDHEQIHAREVVPIDAELADELRQRLVARIRVQCRRERIAALERFENADGLRAPQVDGEMRRKLVGEQERRIRSGLTQEVERFGPAPDEDAASRVREEIEERCERGRLARMRLLRGDEHRTV